MPANAPREFRVTSILLPSTGRSLFFFSLLFFFLSRAADGNTRGEIRSCRDGERQINRPPRFTMSVVRRRECERQREREREKKGGERRECAPGRSSATLPLHLLLDVCSFFSTPRLCPPPCLPLDREAPRIYLDLMLHARSAFARSRQSSFDHRSDIIIAHSSRFKRYR
ncbi:hypothetical protein PUN28_011967 [Cardiocondyla obscurior]|uniref:Transmembrane protein n=1 Tax=Cardiocondyla obscurior TaxID=286306 RepID=A0AAW2F9V3_9HYME